MITTEALKKQLAELEEGKAQMQANLNAQEGAIALCKQLIAASEIEAITPKKK